MNRRAFLNTAAGAAAAALPGCTFLSPAAAAICKAAPYIPTADPVFAAIERWRQSEARLNGAFDALSQAQAELLALGYGYQASVPHRHAPGGTCRSREQIALCYTVDRAAAQGPRLLEDVGLPGFELKPTPEIDEAEAQALAEFDRRAAAIDAALDQSGYRHLEDEEHRTSGEATDALRVALTTVPTTMAGLGALMDLFADQAEAWGLDPVLAPAPKIMAAALSSLLPAVKMSALS